MEKKLDLTPTYLKISKRLEAILQDQAPVDTGTLRRSVSVRYDKNGIWINPGMIDSPTKYGIFLHTGTNEERASGAGDWNEKTYANLSDRAWNPRPGTGHGGIKPRYWMNFSDTVYDMITDEIAQVFAEAETELMQEQMDEILSNMKTIHI